jgi:hypothetical protein
MVGFDWRQHIGETEEAQGSLEAPSAHELHAMAGFDQVAVSLDDDTVTFHDVARAWFGIHDEALPTRFHDVYLEFYRRLLAKFTESRGGIESAYFCQRVKVAAALTDIDLAAKLPAGTNPVAADGGATSPQDVDVGWRDRRRRATASAIHVEPLLGHPRCAESKRLLSRALDIHYRALEFLAPEHRKVCLRRIFSAIAALLGTLDARAVVADPDAANCLTDEPICLTQAEAGSLHLELDEAEAYYYKHAERRAQLKYMVGMGLGFLAVVGFLAAGIAIATGTGGDVTLRDPLIVSLFAGALGAIVSVMTRVKGGTLELERETGGETIYVLGAVRPFLGAVFGALLYVLINGDVIAIGVTDDPTYVTYAGLAFVAGFTERVANGVLDTAAGALDTARREEPRAPAQGEDGSRRPVAKATEV